MERNYYWIRYANEWYIAIKGYDDEQDKMCWYLDGMEMINEPDEVGEMVRRKESPDERGNCLPKGR